MSAALGDVVVLDLSHALAGPFASTMLGDYGAEVIIDITTGRPIFAGAQDGIIYDSFEEMWMHNHFGYDYYTRRPAELLVKERERWRKLLAKGAAKKP